MKNKAIIQDFIIEIKNSLGRFFSILLIVALGVAFFSGIRSSKPDMQLSADHFYDNSNLMDIRILSTLGLTKEDVQAISQVEGVEQVEPAFSLDALCDTQSSQLVVKVLSKTDKLNQINVTDGRLPENSSECLVDKLFIEHSGYKIGDTISLHLEAKDDILDNLSQNKFTITGIGSTSYYLSLERGSSTIGTGKINSFIVVTPDTFLTEAYTEIYASVKDADKLVSYTQEYDDKVKSVVNNIEKIADSRREARYKQVLEEPRTKIQDGKVKLEKEETKAKDKLDDAAKQLAAAKSEIIEGENAIADGKAKLEKGKAELNQNKETLLSSEKEIKTGLQKLSLAQTSLEEGKKQLKEKQAEYETGEQSYADGYQQWNTSMNQWNVENAALLENETMINTALNELQIEKEKLEPAKELYAEQWQTLLQKEQELLANQQSIKDGKLQLEASKVQLDAAKAKLDKEQETLKSAGELLSAESKKMEDAGTNINSNIEKLNKSQSSIDAGWKEIVKGKNKLKESEALLLIKEDELNNGKETLAKNEREYKKAVITSNEKIADARQKIADSEEKLKDIAYPKWYVLDRNRLQTYVEYGQDADRIGNIGKVFPAIFFLVAALVSLTTMTRMVEEERTQIGTLKALGYSKGIIAGKYIMYALFASLLGSLLGILLGEKVLPFVIVSAYRILYNNLPYVIAPYNVYYGVLSATIAVATTTLASLLACYKELLSPPSQLMRPVSPKLGKRVILERIPWLWKKFNFTTKATVRNLLRYKKRFFMTVFGIGGSMALLLVGFGLMDSIGAMSDKQYVDLWHQDCVISIDNDMTDSKKEELYSFIKENPQIIKDSITVKETTVDVGHGKITKSTNLLVPKDVEHLKDYMVLRDRVTHEEYQLQDSSVIIDEKLANLLKVKAGDTIYLTDSGTKPIEVKVSNIVENYMMHYVFMTPVTYESLFGKKSEYNKLYTKNAELSETEEDNLTTELLGLSAVTSVLFTSSLQKHIDDMLTSLNTVVYVLIISAGLLAFVVLYNLNNININERQRELATLKVLGFQDLEVATYVYRENVMLTLIGTIAGIFLGIIMHRYVILTAEIDMIMFGRTIKFSSYIYSILLTFGFSAFVNFVMYYKLRRIDMVESLKSIE